LLGATSSLEHKTQVGAVWTVMLKVIQQFQHMPFAGMVNKTWIG